MALKLYTFPGNPRANKALIAAKYNGVDVTIPAGFVMGETNRTPEFLALNPLGKVPTLETPEGGIFESNAIARYVGGLRADTQLLGGSYFESVRCARIRVREQAWLSGGAMLLSTGPGLHVDGLRDHSPGSACLQLGVPNPRLDAVQPADYQEGSG
jgi:glutathione S-transferase